MAQPPRSPRATRFGQGPAHTGWPRALLAVLGASVCFGTTGTAQALGAPDASSISVGAARIVIGGLLLAVIGVIGRWRRIRRPDSRARPGGEPARSERGHEALQPRGVARPRVAALRRRGVVVAIAIGAAGVVGYQATFFAGTQLNGVAVGTLIALGSAPILTGIAVWLLGRGFPGRRWLAATAAAIVGVTLLTGVAGLAGPSLTALGVLTSLGAGAGYAATTLALKTLLDAGWSPTGAMGTVYGAAGAVSALVLPLTDTAWLWTGSGLATALWLGLVATAVAYTAFGYGLARLPAATVATLTLAEPLVASLLGALVLHERLAATQAVGALVLMLGLTLLALPSRAPVARIRDAAADSPDAEP